MKQTIVIILSVSVLLIIILSVGFYWFQLRPTQIRKDCAFEAGKPTNGLINPYLDESFNQKTYDKCLLEHGLEK